LCHRGKSDKTASAGNHYFHGIIMAVVWALLESPDLAVTEAAVGAGITSILFFLTLRRLGREALIDSADEQEENPEADSAQEGDS